MSVVVEKIPAGVSGADLTRRRQLVMNMKKKPCIYGGVKYDSIKELASYLKVSRWVIDRAIKKGKYKGVKLEKVLDE